MKFYSSLSTRLVVATLTTAAVTIAMLVGLVVLRADKGLREQTAEVMHWSEERLAQRLVGDARLAASRLNTLQQDVSRRFATIARRADVAQALRSQNTVQIVTLLAPALALADLDGAIAFDANLRAISADRMDADILRANTLVSSSPLANDIRSAFVGNNPLQPRGLYRSLQLDERLAGALAATGQSPLVDVWIEPVFDEFGDVVAALVGYRRIRMTEPQLAEFSVLSGRGVLVLHNGASVSLAGVDVAETAMKARPDSELVDIDGGSKVARCIDRGPSKQVCALAPLDELRRLSDQVVQLGEENTRSLIGGLFLAALLSLGLFAGVSVLVASQVTKPLTKITATVGEVARGNWRTGVPGVERRDEVGDIARAVVMLETSLEERDQLRDNVLIQNGALREREEQLRHQNVRFDAALNNMSQGLCMFDGERRLKVFNSQLLSIYGRPEGAIAVGMPLAVVLACLVDPDPASVDALAAESVKTVELGAAASWTRGLADGRSIAISLRPMAGGGWVETHEDVTERRAAETRIAHLASHDVLTELPNRLLFAQRLREAHATLRAGGRGYAVLCVDLDDFKGVNDTLGHAVGDALLCAVARRLESLASSGDTIARLGGDEFAIIHPQTDQPDGGERLAERIVALLRQPFEAGGQGVVSAGSVGVAVGSDAVKDPQRALLNADLALYTAKTDGRGRYRVFEGEMETRFQHRQALERDLRVALAEGAIEVYYQPLFNIQTMRISGLEALARWRHPQRGFVSPGEFVPLAEEVGLIDQLGETVLNQACRDASHWPENLKIAVNVSPVQFRSPGLCHSVVRALAASGLPSWRLELEITESVVLGDDPETLAKLHSLHDLGIKFSMDDFGTGFSSLSGLRNFPFDKIKLDQSFVRDAVVREDAAAIVRIVAELGRSLNMTTLAEGVETPEQLQALQEAGFAEAQGYLFSPAIPARDIPAFIDRSMPFRAVA